MTLLQLKKAYPTLFFRTNEDRFQVSKDEIKWYNFGNKDMSFKYFKTVCPNTARMLEAMKGSDEETQRQQNFCNKLHKYKEQFHIAFHKNIFDFVNYFLWRFNILAFDSFIQPEEGLSLKAHLVLKYGAPHAAMIEDLIS